MPSTSAFAAGQRTRRAAHFSRHVLTALVVGSVLFVLGCPPRSPVRLTSPGPGEIFTSGTLVLDGSLAGSVLLESVSVELDGVDLVVALGLTPPFENAAGVVMIDGAPVDVVDLDLVAPPDSRAILRGRIEGLAGGAHVLQVASDRSGGDSVAQVRDFELVDGLAEAAQAVLASGLHGGPQVSQSGDILVNAALGEPLVGPVAVGTGGEEFRPGIVAVSEAFLAP